MNLLEPFRAVKFPPRGEVIDTHQSNCLDLKIDRNEFLSLLLNRCQGVARHEATADVGVGVRRRIVDIAVQRTSIQTIVPIAANIADIAGRRVEVPVEAGRSIDNPIENRLSICESTEILYILHSSKPCNV